MLRIEIEGLLELWPVGSSKIFKYIREFVPVEYIIITKILDNEYRCERDKSTYDLGIIKKEEIERFLRVNELKHYSDSTWSDCHELKTGGCTCGSWATINHDLHHFGCKKYKNPFSR